MADFTNQLRLELQIPGENPGTWGTQLNEATIRMLEQAVSGLVVIPLSAGTRVLTVQNGSSDESRPMVLKFTGAFTGDAIVSAPNVAKLYVVWVATTSGSVKLKTTSGTEQLSLPQGLSVVIGDGSRFYLVSSGNFNPADNNATSLGGVGPDGYARLGEPENFTAGQAVGEVVISPSGGNVTLDFSQSNVFRAAIGATSVNLLDPVNMKSGQQFVLHVARTVSTAILNFSPRWRYIGNGTLNQSAPATSTAIFISGYYSAVDNVVYFTYATAVG